MSGCNNNIRDGLNLHLTNLNVDSTTASTLPNHCSEDSEDEQLYYRCIPTCPEFEHTSNILVSAVFTLQHFCFVLFFRFFFFLTSNFQHKIIYFFI